MTICDTDMKNRSANILQSSYSDSSTSARDYVQDGLIVMYDGIENAGYSTHNSKATAWKDLIGSYDLVVPSQLTWHDECLEFDGLHSAYNLSLPHSSIGLVWTCECVYLIEETGTNYKGLFGCRLNTGGDAWPQVYGLNYYTTVGGWNMGNGGSSDIAINSYPELRSLVDIGRKNYLVLGQKSDKSLVAGANGAVSVEKSTPTAVNLTHSGIMLGRGYENPTSVDSSRCLKSKIYAFRLYRRTLEAEEIAHNYALDVKRFGLGREEMT